MTSPYEYNFQSYIHVHRRIGAEIIGHCPFHDDKNPSFSGNAENGCWKCFAGCGSGNWQSFTWRLESNPVKSEPIRKTNYSSQNMKFRKGILEATYVYNTLNGAPALAVKRFKTEGTQKKYFTLSNWKNGQWVPGDFQGELAPYLFEKWKRSKHVILVEGEKVADQLNRLGFLATTTPKGSNNWKACFAKYFTGKIVIILPDNDVPGFAYAQSALLNIKKFATQVKIVELPNLKEKEDAFDWFEKRGGTKPLLKQILLKELQDEE